MQGFVLVAALCASALAALHNQTSNTATESNIATASNQCNRKSANLDPYDIRLHHLPPGWICMMALEVQASVDRTTLHVPLDACAMLLSCRHLLAKFLSSYCEQPASARPVFVRV